jgi:hypothetical protein
MQEIFVALAYVGRAMNESDFKILTVTANDLYFISKECFPSYTELIEQCESINTNKDEVRTKQISNTAAEIFLRIYCLIFFFLLQPFKSPNGSNCWYYSDHFFAQEIVNRKLK